MLFKVKEEGFKLYTASNCEKLKKMRPRSLRKRRKYPRKLGIKDIIQDWLETVFNQSLVNRVRLPTL